MKDTTVELSTRMKETEYQSDFAFPVYILEKYYELNLKLQGKGAYADELYAAVKSFQVKLMLFQGS